MAGVAWRDSANLPATLIIGDSDCPLAIHAALSRARAADPHEYFLTPAAHMADVYPSRALMSLRTGAAGP
jgi:hypothetical protein